MASDSQSHGTKKRVSFLMPYIDFCFMLIIIFIGMLSIAYFEPLGRTDIQNKQDQTIDNLEGKYSVKPVGVQERKEGVGEDTPQDIVRPLVRKTGGTKSSALIQSQGNKKNRRAGVKSTKENSDSSSQMISRKDLEAYKKLIAEKQLEIERLTNSIKSAPNAGELKNKNRVEIDAIELETYRKKITEMQTELARLKNLDEKYQKVVAELDTLKKMKLSMETTGKEKPGDHFYLDLRK